MGEPSAQAQSLPPSTADDQLGVQPYQSYHGSDFDLVGLSNGTLTLHYPLLSYSQRGSLRLSFSLSYNNKLQHVAQECIPTPPQGQQCFLKWGFTPNPPPLPLESSDPFVSWDQQLALVGTNAKAVTNAGLTDQTTTHYSRWSVQTADGAMHPLGNVGTQSLVAGCPGCSDQNFYSVAAGPLESLDATGYRVNGPLATQYPAGPTSLGPTGNIVDSMGVVGGLQDPNGNVITPTTNSQGAIIGLTDTVGRQILLPPTAGSASNTDTSNCPQSPLAVDHAVLWSVPAPNGASAPYKFCYVQVPVNIPPNAISDSQAVTGPSFQLQSIVLPDLHHWDFQYNDPGDGSVYNGSPVNYGSLTQITLPTGGTVSYTYRMGGVGLGFNCQNNGRWVASRTVNANDSIGGQSWSYSYSVSAGSLVTKVIDPLLNYVIHTFAPLSTRDGCPAHETQTQYFQQNGTLLKTVSTSYNSTDFSRNSNGPTNVVPTQIITIWPDGKQASVTKNYDSGFNYLDFTGSSANSNNAPNAGIYGKEVSESASDWGPGQAGPTLRATNTNYLAFANSSYLAANMLDLVSSKTVADGSGCKLAETDYTYDESNYLTPYPNSLPQGSFGNPPNPSPVLGHATTVTQQLFPGGTCPTTAQAGPASHINWYNTGMAYQALDPLGNATTHNYDPADGGAYPTKTINALNQPVTGAYDLNTGLMTVFTDANNNSTTFGYDSMRRITSVLSPKDAAGNQPLTTFNYSPASSGFPITIQRLKSVTAGLSDSLTTTLDGLGRTSQTQHATPNGNATVTTTYDQLGRVASVTNPYFSTSDPTYGVTYTQYDALGRVQQLAPPDGTMPTAGNACQANNICTQYADNVTTVTDQAGNQRRTTTDALGRLVEVDEPSTGFRASGQITLSSALLSQSGVGASPAIPATGSVTINGSDPNTYIGSVTITGTEGFTTRNPCLPKASCPQTVWDTGTVSFSINGITASTQYSQGSNTSNVAAALASQFSGTAVSAQIDPSNSSKIDLQATGGLTYTFLSGADFKSSFSGATFAGDTGSVSVTADTPAIFAPYTGGSTAASVAAQLVQNINSENSLVSASVPSGGNLITLTARNAGAAGNSYGLSASVSGNQNPPAFSVSTSEATLTGGADANPGTTVTDSGTVSMSDGTVTVSTCYAPQPSNSCPTILNLHGISPPYPSSGAAVAAILAQKLTAASSLVTATASGPTISVVAVNPGAGADNVTVSVSSVPSNSTLFPGGSFSGRATLSGGAGAGALTQPYTTLYNYDALGNVVCVEQHGDAANGTGCSASPSSDASSPWRVRRFAYDSLSRLVTAKNPESGTISYSYDANSNLAQKTSPQANQFTSATTTISYCYDGLNRVTGRAYSAQSCPLSNPVVAYTYDGGTNGVGHLTSLTDQAGSGSYGYDALGRILTEQRTIAGISKSMSYSYNLDGSIASLTYPSNAVVAYTPWNNGSIAVAGTSQSAADGGNGINYGSLANYQADGQITAFTSGNSGGFAGITNSFTYNKRLQPINISAASPAATVFSLTYDFHLGAGDNGDVFGVTNNQDTTRSQTFAYDSLNRLISAQNSGSDCSQTTANGKTKFWGNSYLIDAWGNLVQKQVTKCSSENLSVSVGLNNQLQGGYVYDAAGNLTFDATSGLSYVYDQENRITGANGFTYTYDDDGNRVEKSNGSTGTLYWYMGPGIVAESDLGGNLQSEYVFFAGERVARRDLPGGAVSYYFSDHLKTASVITDSSGNITAESDYYPWGGEIQFSNNDSNHYKFTGKERDGETGLDDFGARYYSNGLGRFVSADWSAAPTPVPYASFSNPQSLNLYTYSSNNPTTFADLNGHYEIPGSGACQGQVLCEAPTGDDKKQDGATSEQHTVQQEIQDAKARGAYEDQIITGILKETFNDLQGIMNPIGPTYHASNETQALGMKIAFVGMFLIPGGGEEAAAVKGERVFVYVIKDAGKTIYVGITDNLERRGAQHGAQLIWVLRDLSRKEARAAEQVLIERIGLSNLRNKINSISTRNPIYKEAIQIGKKLLEGLPLP